MPRRYRAGAVVTVDGRLPYPVPSAYRCTITDIDEMRRCALRDGHGWAHHFDWDVDQGICGSVWIARNGMARTCALPEDHIDPCVYLALTERRATIADVIGSV